MTEFYDEAELYDLMYAGFLADIEPTVRAARAANGRVLEVCCGTGRLLLPVLEAGVRCDGLDRAPAMLARCREKLAARGLRAELHQADMRDFTLPHRYALIAIGFNSFLHNLTQQDQLATLLCCREHLEVGGALQLDAFQPSVVRLAQPPDDATPSLDVPIAGSSERLRVFEQPEDDRIEQVRRITRRIERVDAAGAVLERREVTMSLRYVWKPEMELLLRVAGFARWSARLLCHRFDDPAAVPDDAPPGEGMLRWTAWKD